VPHNHPAKVSAHNTQRPLPFSSGLFTLFYIRSFLEVDIASNNLLNRSTDIF